MLLAVAADGVLWADGSRFLRGGCLFRRGRLLVDIHVGLAVVVLQYGVDAADLHASAAWGARIIDVPRTWNVFGKLVVFVCHRIGVVCN